jgi:hypothetical protein
MATATNGDRWGAADYYTIGVANTSEHDTTTNDPGSIELGAVPPQATPAPTLAKLSFTPTHSGSDAKLLYSDLSPHFSFPVFCETVIINLIFPLPIPYFLYKYGWGFIFLMGWHPFRNVSIILPILSLI